MYPFKIIAFPFFLLAPSLSVFAGDDAFDLFVEACLHSGYNPAAISTFQAELSITARHVYPDSYVERKRLEEANEELPIRGNTEAERQRSKESWESIRSRRYSQEPFTRNVKIAFNNSAAHLGLDDELGQSAVIETDGTRSYLYQVGSGIRDSNRVVVGKEAKVSLDQFDNLTKVGVGGTSPDSHHHLHGRAWTPHTSSALGVLLVRDDNGRFAMTEESKSAFKQYGEKYGVSYKLLNEKENYDGDHVARLLEVRVRGKLREQLWIDPDRGYLCPHQKMFYSNDGSPDEEERSEDFVFDERSQKWFPQKVTQSSWHELEGEKIAYHAEISVIPDTALMINQPIPDSVFSLAIAQRDQIIDTRREDHDTAIFVAKQPAELDLPTAEKKDFLDHADWVTSRPPIQPQETYTIEKASFSWTRIVLISIGVILVIAGLISRFFFGK